VDTLVDSPQSALSGVARVLVHAGKLGVKSAEELVKSAKERRVSFVSTVIGNGSVSATELAHTLSSTLALPLLDLNAVDSERLPRNIVDAKLAVQYQIVVLGRRGNRLFIGGADPTNQEAVERIKFATQLSPEWVIVEYDKLSKILEGQGASANDTIESLAVGDFDFDVAEDESGAAESAEVAQEVEDAPVVRFLQKMLIDAINMRASDLHFEPYEYNYRVRFRIDGELREITQPPIAIKDKLASRIKVISRLDIAEKRVPQDGRMKLKFGNRAIDFRVSTLPTLFGEKIVIRILDPSSAKLGIEALGYEKIEKERLLSAIQRPYGMILVTGPTGSGKTVSLYTCLNILNQPGVNISTVEDPAEINLPGVNQVNVNDKAGLNFAVSLKAFLRQDPDIIMVGEIRDLETADIAHQRRTHDADAPVEHGRRPVQYRRQRAADHRPATRPSVVRELQTACGLPARIAPARRLHGRGSRRFMEALPRGGVFRVQQRLQGPGRSVPGHAHHRGDSTHHPLRGHGDRHRHSSQQGGRSRPAAVWARQGPRRRHESRRSDRGDQRIVRTRRPDG
jgi:type IV pilus assembly protein PilB